MGGRRSHRLSDSLCCLLQNFEIILVLMIVIAVIIGFGFLIATPRSSPDSCSSTHTCDHLQALTCINDFCVCDKNVSIYSSIHGKCLGLSGKPCVERKCVPGANCKNGESCVCDENHYDHPVNGSCLPKKRRMEKCSQDEECPQKCNLNLTCLQGICNCESSEICPATVGQECTNYCVPQAKCIFPNEILGNGSARNLSGLCECNDGFQPNKYGTQCAKGFGTDCGKIDDCIEGLVCIEGKCSCPLPNYQFFDNSTKSCVTPVGIYCSGEESTCTPNAYCELVGRAQKKGYCKCLEGFVENAAGGCDVAHGQTCLADVPCDSVASLVCLNNTCVCPDEKMQLFSKEKRHCVGLEGATCLPGDESACTESAFCFQENPKMRGKCKCMYGVRVFRVDVVDFTC